ncbi:putative HTH-type transcriptional regulator [archaeon HR01]|nr:putative HTH-type transcriptional regulator [archaeon HR01]
MTSGFLDDKFYEELAEFCKGQANPKRLKILHLLSDGEKTVGEISRMLGIPQANISQHLGYMRRAGVVKARRVGSTVYYSVADSRISEACGLISQVVADRIGITVREKAR